MAPQLARPTVPSGRRSLQPRGVHPGAARLARILPMLMTYVRGGPGQGVFAKLMLAVAAPCSASQPCPVAPPLRHSKPPALAVSATSQGYRKPAVARVAKPAQLPARKSPPPPAPPGLVRLRTLGCRLADRVGHQRETATNGTTAPADPSPPATATSESFQTWCASEIYEGARKEPGP